jgi:S1-C subfamily serine protease
MEHLSKQQLILLALLVSFVTSLSTGIFTVSLMSQAPQGVMQTINQVVEKTIEKAVTPNGTASVAGSSSDSAEKSASNAISIVSKSLVKIADSDNNNNILGIGLILTKKGIVMTDKAVIAPATHYNIILADGSVLPVNASISQTSGDVVFLMPNNYDKLPNINPINYASSVYLGEQTYYMNGTSTLILKGGLVVTADNSGTSLLNNETNIVNTNITLDKNMSGGVLFDVDGRVIGINTSSMRRDNTGTDFFPVMSVRQIVQGL